MTRKKRTTVVSCRDPYSVIPTQRRAGVRVVWHASLDDILVALFGVASIDELYGSAVPSIQPSRTEMLPFEEYYAQMAELKRFGFADFDNFDAHVWIDRSGTYEEQLRLAVEVLSHELGHLKIPQDPDPGEEERKALLFESVAMTSLEAAFNFLGQPMQEQPGLLEAPYPANLTERVDQAVDALRSRDSLPCGTK